MGDAELSSSRWLILGELAVVVEKPLSGGAIVSCPEGGLTESGAACHGELLVVSGGPADHVCVRFNVVHVKSLLVNDE